MHQILKLMGQTCILKADKKINLKSIFRLRAVCRLWKLELFVWVGYKVGMLCNKDSCYWSLFWFFFLFRFAEVKSQCSINLYERHIFVLAALSICMTSFSISEQKQFNTIQPNKLTYCIGVSPTHNAVWAALKPHILQVFHLKMPIDWKIYVQFSCLQSWNVDSKGSYRWRMNLVVLVWANSVLHITNSNGYNSPWSVTVANATSGVSN